MKELYIIGAGGFGREVAWLVERINEIEPTWEIKGFIDDNCEKWNKNENGYLIYGGCDYLINLAEKNEIYAVCAVGNATVRKRIIAKFENSNVKFATVIDPSVIMSNRVNIGEGVIICAGTIITVDVTIGNYVIINLDCTVGHDALVSDYVTIYPSVNISGNVTVGECTELGTGMQIIQGIDVSSNVIVGAGAVVNKNIVESGTYVGVPVQNIIK